MRLLLLSTLILFGCSNADSIHFLPPPVGEYASLPRLFTDSTGTVSLSWVEEHEGMASLYTSMLIDEEWTPPKFIQSSDSWFVNWADFPSVITNNGRPMAAHWLKKIPGGTYSYNVEITSFSDSDLETLTPHNDSTATEHGFVSLHPVTDTSFYAVWLDGRFTGSHAHHSENLSLNNAMTLRGALVSTELSVLSEAEIDANVCDCCNTSLTMVDNTLLVAYRNRTASELRDIEVRRLEDGSWSDPVQLEKDEWNINGCPVNGPAIDAFQKEVALAWFTGADGDPKVKIAFSNDAGRTFKKPILVDESEPIGRVDVVMNSDKSAWISWISRTESGAHLVLNKIGLEGDVKENHIITDIDPSRKTGFPQLTHYGEQLIIAWTKLTEESTTIQAVLIPR